MSGHETEPLLDTERGTRAEIEGRVRRIARKVHDTVLKPLGRPSVWRPALLVLAVLNLLALLSLFSGRKEPGEQEDVLDRVCTSRDCVQVSYELQHSMNRTVDPCDDFYEYSTGGWRASHPIPSDSGLFGIGQFVLANNNKVLHNILQGDVEPSSRADKESLAKLRTFYGACVDTKSQDKEGAKPLLDELFALHKELHASKDSLTGAVAWLHARGVNVLFEPAVEGDPGHGPLTATPQIAPGGLSLPDTTYYDDDEVLGLYRSILVQGVEALGKALRSHKAMDVLGGEPGKIADAIIDFEKKLAGITPDVVELSDPLQTYNPMSGSQLQKLAPAIDWDAYLHEMSTSGVSPHKVVVASTAYVKKLSALLEKTPARTVRAYLYWSVVRELGLFLGPNVGLGEPARRLNRFANGLDEDAKENRDTTCLDAVSAALGYMSGRFYAEATFGPESKSQVEELMDTIRLAFFRKLQKLPWLDSSTRETARQKAEAIVIKIGYPSTPNSESASAIRDWYASLQVGDSYFANQVAAHRFLVHEAWSHIGGSLNTGLIGDLMPAEVNAEYNAAQNEIVFPAGLLQPPYFDPTWPMYLQYGAFGTTAGHELSHAFDPSGRLFDKNGYLDDWWTPETAKAFEDRQRCIEEQYGNYTISDGEGHEYKLQSKFTIGEDVADAGGLAQSYSAWKYRVKHGNSQVWKRNQRLPGLTEFTQEQLFFLAYGAAWARNIRPGEAIKRLKTDPHAPTKYRVNGALVNFPPFAEAFGCKAGRDAMALPPKQRCEIW